MTAFSRRGFLAATLAVGGTSYCYQRGLRYPRLSLSPHARSNQLARAGLKLELIDTIATDNPDELKLRAIAPEPALLIDAERGRHRFEIANISEHAVIDVHGKGIKLVDEDINGLTRIITIDAAIDQHLELKWQLPVSDGFEFAVIGDTGGGLELSWALERARELDTLFLLHLGDFNYGGEEYQQAIDQFRSSPIPVYVSIGNHDFNDNGLIYKRFLDDIGPMNNCFTLAGTEFINIDTGACFLPVHGGQRGEMFANLHASESKYSDRVFFTHRPVKDPRPFEDHDAGSVAETEWIAKQIKALNGTTLLAGHVHHSSELDYNGLHQHTIGEGLGHEDLIHQKQVAQILVGKVEPAKQVSYRWVNLDMPWTHHTNHTHEKKLIRQDRPKQLAWYRELNNIDTAHSI